MFYYYEATHNLLSSLKLKKRVSSNLYVAKLNIKNGKIFMTGRSQKFIHCWSFPKVISGSNFSMSNDLIHHRMGHSSIYKPVSLCDICIKGKMTRSPFKTIDKSKMPTRILEVVSTVIVV